MHIECVRVEDRLRKYHPYTVAFREPGSTRYQDFGELDPRTPNAPVDFVQAHPWTGDRRALAQSLNESLAALDAPQPVLDNVARLAEPNTVAIVAGHQPALFGGQLFLLFKLMSVIRLCEALNERGGPTFVPVYWNGSEEHNLAEFGRATIFDREHDQAHFTLPGDGRRCMAAATPAESARPLLTDLERSLPDTEFLSGLMGLLFDAAGGSLGEMMTRLVLRFFGEHGLIVVEPRMLRALAAPVIARALLESEALHACLNNDSDAMRCLGYEPSLPHREAGRTLVYYLADGQRHRVCVQDDGFGLEKQTQRFTREALVAELHEAPTHFGPSAALRPAVQAAVLPVAGYVAGGGELAYHMQLRRLFTHLGLAMPLLIPRAAGTILKPSCLKTMKRIGLDLQDLIAPGWEWDAIAAASEARGAGQQAAFASFRDRLDESFEALRQNLQQSGLENQNELDRERERFLGRLEGVENRFRSQDPVVGEGPRRQYYRLRKFVFPGESYQELSAWTVYFLALYGPDLLPALLEHIDPLSARHHVFVVS